MASLVTAIKGMFESKPLSPTQRYEKESQKSPRDLAIKRFAVDTFYNGSLATLATSIVAPLIVVNFATGGAMLAITAAAAGVFGVATSIWGMGKSNELNKEWDWTDYSNKVNVEKDSIAITNLDLNVLVKNSSSPVHRISNLKRYGVLSDESAKTMQSIVDRYLKIKQIITDLDYQYPLITRTNDQSNPSVQKISLAFQNAKLELKSIKTEWKSFQQAVKSDLPELDLSN